MTYLSQGITIVFLAICSIADIKKREIPLILTGIYGLSGVAVCVIDGRNIYNLCIPISLGLLLIALSILTKGDIGMGDGLIIIALGFMLPLQDYTKCISLGMLAAAAFSGILIVAFKKGKKAEIPLVPFLFAGYIGGLLL